MGKKARYFNLEAVLGTQGTIDKMYEKSNELLVSRIEFFIRAITGKDKLRKSI